MEKTVVIILSFPTIFYFSKKQTKSRSICIVNLLSAPAFSFDESKAVLSGKETNYPLSHNKI